MDTKHLLCLLIAAIPLMCATSERDLARGAEILQPFKQQLQGALREGMARGPADAIAACRMKAPEIAASLSIGMIPRHAPRVRSAWTRAAGATSSRSPYSRCA
jgi:hypothetical protein